VNDGDHEQPLPTPASTLWTGCRWGSVQGPLTRVGLFVVCTLSLFHCAHRSRLYDGLQIKHLNEVVIVLCYGGAIVGTVWAAYLLVRIG